MGVGRKGEGSGKQEQVARVSSPKAVLPPAKGEEEKKNVGTRAVIAAKLWLPGSGGSGWNTGQKQPSSGPP